MYTQENESVKDLLHAVSNFHDIPSTSSVWRLICVRQFNVLFILYNVFCMLIGAMDRQLVLNVHNTVNNQLIMLKLITVDGFGIQEHVTGIY